MAGKPKEDPAILRRLARIARLAGLIHRWRVRRRPDLRIERAYRRRPENPPPIPSTAPGPFISVVMPLFNTPAPLLAEAIDSVTAQDFPHWELCIADDASTAPHIATQLASYSARDPRIKCVRLPQNTGIASATNAALALAQGEYIALLDHDDTLAPHALARVAQEIANYPEADVLFSDEDKLTGTTRHGPYFKPGWNPDLLLSQNLVSHLGIYRRTLLTRLGGLRDGFQGSQDHDLALRATAACTNAQIRHIPEVLYHWRQLPRSFSASHAAAASEAARRALREHLPTGTLVQPDPDLPQWSRILHPLPTPPPLVSIVTTSANPIATTYEPIERVQTADAASGHILVFLANDLQPVSKNWLQELASQALRPGIAAVGGRLDLPGGRIWQSGVILHPDRIADTLSPGSDLDDPGYSGHFRLARNVSAISAACLAIRRDLFLQAGGFEPTYVCYADIDLCLCLAQQNLRCVWTPYARLRHRNRPDVPHDLSAIRLMQAQWGEKLANDPYLNPNLVVQNGNLTLAKQGKRKARQAVLF